MNRLPFIHETANVEKGVEIGEGTAVWDTVHIRAPSRIGEDCIIGEKTYIAYDVEIGNKVKINAQVYICAGVEIEDGVMVSAGTVFTNDRFPAPPTPSSPPCDHRSRTRPGPTIVREGATIGAGAVIGPGVELGRWSMIGMGSIVTKPVPAFHLALGNPARSFGAVCRCGQPLIRFQADTEPSAELVCRRCARLYSLKSGEVIER